MMTELPQHIMNSKLYNSFWVFIWGLIINFVVTIPIFFLFAFIDYGLNSPNGSSGINYSLVTLCFTSCFWIIFCLYKYKRIAKHLFYAYLINFILNFIVLTTLSILYYNGLR
jgi:hypothetical protein